MTRQLTEEERVAVCRLAESLPEPSRVRIIADLKHATVAAMNDAGTIIRFEIPGYEHPLKSGGKIKVDAKMKDRDGAQLDVILFTDENDRLYELELVRFAEGAVIGPDWDTLSYY